MVTIKRSSLGRGVAKDHYQQCTAHKCHIYCCIENMNLLYPSKFSSMQKCGRAHWLQPIQGRSHEYETAATKCPQNCNFNGGANKTGGRTLICVCWWCVCQQLIKWHNASGTVDGTLATLTYYYRSRHQAGKPAYMLSVDFDWRQNYWILNWWKTGWVLNK